MAAVGVPDPVEQNAFMDLGLEIRALQQLVENCQWCWQHGYEERLPELTETARRKVESVVRLGRHLHSFRKREPGSRHHRPGACGCKRNSSSVRLLVHAGEGPPLTELEIARAIARGDLASPQDIGGSWLFALRITGTGMARRADERVWRDVTEWTRPEMLARCNGLHVIWEHPPGDVLTSDEFADRVIGSVTLPYVAGRDGKQREDGSQIWGIARVFDAQAAKIMATEVCSTSPCVVFGKEDGNTIFGNLLIEGRPSRLDHVAICERGVWDKGDAPSGVRVDNSTTQSKDTIMSDTTDTGGGMDRVLELLEGLDARLSKLEGGDQAEADKTKADEGASGQNGTASSQDLARDNRQKAADRAKADADDKDKPFEEREGAVADSAYQSRINEHRARADEVAAAWGTTTTKPFFGESINDYRRRCLKGFQKHSRDYANIDLARVPAELMDVAERTIYADALKASFSPASAGPGRLREIKRTDASGRVISTFVGSVGAWLDDFKGPVQYLTGIKTKFD